MRVSVVIPLLNEESTLVELHARLSRVLRSISPEGHQIVFVNDGSTDGSAAILERIAKDDPCVTVIEFRRTFGKAAGLAAGFREAQGELLVTMDADLQDVPEELPLLIDRIESGADFVTGRKRRRQDPWTRLLASRIFNLAVSLATGVRVRDVNSGFKAMRREVMQNVPSHGELHRYLPVLANAKGYKIDEVDVEHRPRRFGRSRYGWSRYTAGILDTVTVLMLTRYDKRPIHFFGIFGILLTLVGLGILSYLSAGWFFGHYIGNRPLLTLGVITVILGMQCVFFGLLAELLVLRERDVGPGYVIKKRLRARQPL